MNSQYGPRSLREAFDMTLVFEREHQVTQPMCTFNVMETCYEEPQVQEEFATEEVQTRAQTQGQGYQQNYQGNPSAVSEETLQSVWSEVLSRELQQELPAPRLQTYVSAGTQAK